MPILHPAVAGPPSGRSSPGNLIAALAWMNSAWESPRLARLRSLVARETGKPRNQQAVRALLSGRGPEARETLTAWVALGLPGSRELAQQDPEAARIAGVATGRIPITNPNPGNVRGRTIGRRPDPEAWRPSPALRAAQVGADALLPGSSAVLEAIAYAVDNELPFDEAFKNTLRAIPGIGTLFGMVDDFVTWLGRELGIGESDAERREREWREWLQRAPQRLEEYARQLRDAQELRQKAARIRDRLARDPAFAQSQAGYEAAQEAAALERDAGIVETIVEGKVEAEQREAEYAQQLDEERADPMERVERHSREMAQQQARHEGAIERGFDLAQRAAEEFDKASERFAAEAAELEKWARMARARARDLESRNEAIIDSLKQRGLYQDLPPGSDPSMGIPAEYSELARDYQRNRREAEAYRKEAAAWAKRARWLREKERRAREREEAAERQAERNRQRAAEQMARAAIISRIATGQGTPEDYRRLSEDPSLQREFRDAVQAVEQTSKAPPTQPTRRPTPPTRPADPPQPTQEPTWQVPPVGLESPEGRFREAMRRLQQTPSYVDPASFTRQPQRVTQPVSLPEISIPAPPVPRQRTQPVTAPQFQQQQLIQLQQLQQQHIQQIQQQPQFQTIPAQMAQATMAPTDRCADVDPAARKPGTPGYWCTQWSGYGANATCVQFVDDCLHPRVGPPPEAPAQAPTPTVTPSFYRAPTARPRRGARTTPTAPTSPFRGTSDLM